MIVRGTSCLDWYLQGITSIGKHIDIHKLYIWIEKNIFWEEIGSDESSTSGDDESLFGHGVKIVAIKMKFDILTLSFWPYNTSAHYR
jgi:hypothetical protein